MLKFTEIDRQMPQKREAKARVSDFGEIYEGFADQLAKDQASRCSQCGVPFCQSKCPLGNHIPDWLRLAAEGQLQEAYALSNETSALPEICGRICPQDRLCEGSCVIEQSTHGTVTIGAVEQYITDQAWEEGWVEPITPNHEREESVAIIGAGPAGLAAADRLRGKGFKVSIYDRSDRAGGLLTYGIPQFKLEKDVVLRRIKRLEEAGVVFHLDTDVGKDISFDELRENHDAVLIATGVYKAKSLTIPIVEPSPVLEALPYLTNANRSALNEDDDASLSAIDKNVVVIGGGDTAMDCVRTAIRQGAKSVQCVYRRDRKNMPGSAREVQNAEEEGVVFRWLRAPKAILTNDGTVTALKIINMQLGEPDKSGRQQPQEIKGSEEEIRADMIIAALGFDPEDLPLAFDEPALRVSPWGTVTVDAESYQTPLEGVFAAGDIVRGASLVVWGVHDGQQAAAGIENYLNRVGRS